MSNSWNFFIAKLDSWDGRLLWLKRMPLYADRGGFSFFWKSSFLSYCNVVCWTWVTVPLFNRNYLEILKKQWSLISTAKQRFSRSEDFTCRCPAALTAASNQPHSVWSEFRPWSVIDKRVLRIAIKHRQTYETFFRGRFCPKVTNRDRHRRHNLVHMQSLAQNIAHALAQFQSWDARSIRNRTSWVAFH